MILLESWQRQFEREHELEEQGAAAAIAGKTREDNPYSREADFTGWVFWENGLLIAQGELEILKTGRVDVEPFPLCSTAEHSFEHAMKLHKPRWMPVKEAFDKGLWDPRFVKP